MTSLSQAQRTLRLTTALGPDALLIERFTGEEALSTPGLFTLELVSEDPQIQAADLLRTPACVTLVLPTGAERFIHGRIRRFTQLGERHRLTEYRAELVPWLWFLSLSSDCRIFQKMSVPDIVTQVFRDLGHTDFRLSLTGTYAPREYCVQYRETHLAFVSRLLEEEGIFYFFEYEADKHVLVLADAPSAVQPCPLQSQVRLARQGGASQLEDVVTGLVVEHTAQTGKIALTDYNYLTPLSNLAAALPGDSDEEVYDYPGRYAARDAGERYARIRLEEHEAMRKVVHGEGTARDFRPGYRFTLTGHYRSDANISYQLVRVRHEAGSGGFQTGRGDDELDYQNSFVAIPADVPYRSPRVTPRPVVQGSQTAVVVGKAGEEIWTETHGRVKVQFHWDRLGKKDENSSCWVRVSTAWAGKGYGQLSTPRIGQEVIVDFLEGDPDQPIITGKVYNADQTPPCDPGGKGGVVSGLRSKTHKGGGFNEMTMDDTTGKEKISIHAQYDMVTVVEHDDTQTVTSGNRKIDVLAGTHTETIKGDTAITITTGTHALTVAAGTQTTTVNKAIAVTSQTASIHVTAATEILLQVGSSKLLMKANGEIELSGTALAIKGTDSIAITGGQIKSKADTSHEIEGAIVKSNGSATNTVKGGMVMLNPD